MSSINCLTELILLSFGKEVVPIDESKFVSESGLVFD